ncbi:MAG: S46 family peptidase [Oligoflexus sp.]
MKRRTLCRLGATTLLGLSLNAYAVEGMWQPEQLPEISADLKKKGLELKPENLTDLMAFPMNAIVSLGGCSASFVSDQGLVVTNHHCAYGSIQYNSKPEKNLLEDGFVAKNFVDELPATPGSRVYVTVKIEDVTNQITDKLDQAKNGLERYETIEKRRKELVAQCEQDAGHRCRVDAFFGGANYRLTKQLEITDVRLVYAPASAVGKYGGDIDNWMWPRHTGDFAFYRAYVDKNGKPAAYSKDNVPYRPKHRLAIEPQGVEAGDFVMVLGYPGRTNRHRLTSEVAFTFSTYYPKMKRYLDDRIALIEGMAEKQADIRITYAGRLAGFNNYSKNIEGQLEGYESSKLLARKKADEKDFVAYLNKNKNKDALHNLKELETLITKEQQGQEANFVDLLLLDSQLYATARWLYRHALEQEKSDTLRESGYQERDLPMNQQRMVAMTRRYDANVDQAIWFKGLQEARSLAKDMELPDAYQNLLKLDAKKLNAQLSKMYQESSISQEKERMRLLQAKAEDFRKSKDPIVQLAVAAHDYHMQRENEAKERNGWFQKYRAQYMNDLIAFYRSKGQAIYPDANSTLRITYGTVQGYTDRSGTKQEPFTVLEGIADKHSGEEPFNSPAEQLKLIQAKDYGSYASKKLKTVPVNFLADLDITGGNSGSAALDGNGKLVGLAFDGTIDGVISDWGFDPAFTRAIQVDIRYMLWVMEKLDDATFLIQEMKAEGKAS